MGALLNSRRRQVAMRGRPMVLRRTGLADLPVQGFDRAFSPSELTGGLQTGDLRVELLHDEIAAAAWPAPPVRPDRLILDGRTYAVLGAHAVHDGPAVIGWSIWCRGS